MQKKHYNIIILKKVLDLQLKKLKLYYSNLHISSNNNYQCLHLNNLKVAENNKEKLVIKHLILKIDRI